MGCMYWEYSSCHQANLGREVDQYDPNRQRKYFLESLNGRDHDPDLLPSYPHLSLNWIPLNPPRDFVLHWMYKYELHIIPFSNNAINMNSIQASIFTYNLSFCNTTIHITSPTLFVTWSNSERITVWRPFATKSSTLNFQHNEGRNPLSIFKCPHIRITVFGTRKKTVILRIPI